MILPFLEGGKTTNILLPDKRRYYKALGTPQGVKN